uniref:Secreted protein n=1 Tax=Trypanosoma vivax (strain Y486) TaxID=1055687 RepID=G0UAG4_TRYVY|nr:hypothetical protein TVY486_1102820 [Trypanosoma vivax Y486]
MATRAGARLTGLLFALFLSSVSSLSFHTRPLGNEYSKERAPAPPSPEVVVLCVAVSGRGGLCEERALGSRTHLCFRTLSPCRISERTVSSRDGVGRQCCPPLCTPRIRFVAVLTALPFSTYLCPA